MKKILFVLITLVMLAALSLNVIAGNENCISNEYQNYLNEEPDMIEVCNDDYQYHPEEFYPPEKDKDPLAHFPEYFIDERMIFDGVLVMGANAPGSDGVALDEIIRAFKERGVKVVDDPIALDYEIEDPKKHNLIVVGRPCENKIAAEMLDYYYEECSAIGLDEGQCLLKVDMHDDKVQFLVTGKTKEDVKHGAELTAKYIKEKQVPFKGKEAIIDCSPNKKDPEMKFFEGNQEKCFADGFNECPIEEWDNPEECADKAGGDGVYLVCPGSVVKHDLGLVIETVDINEKGLELYFPNINDRRHFNEEGQFLKLEFKDIIYKIQFLGTDFKTAKILIETDKGDNFQENEDEWNWEEIEGTPEVNWEEKPNNCNNGCKQNGNCLPYGTRLIEDDELVFCSIEGELQHQRGIEDKCQNNYECSSNQCSNGKCIDLSGQIEKTQGMLEGIFNWVKKIFG